MPDDPSSTANRPADRWREAILTARLGVFDWDLVSGSVDYSPELEEALGLAPGKGDSIEPLRLATQPEDLGLLDSTLSEVSSGRRALALVDVRLRAADGGWRWARVRARICARLDDATPARIVGTVADVQEWRRGRVAARENQLRLHGIVNSAMDAIISVDDHQRITLFNRAAERMFGYAAREVLDQPLDLLIPARFQAAHHGHIEAFGRTGVPSRPMMAQRIVSALRKSGEEFPIDASISQSEVGGQRHFTVILRDVTARERTRLELEQAREDLRALAVASRTAREQENSRISRELHDELGQNLTSLKMDLAWLDTHCPPGHPRFVETLGAMRSVLDSTVAATRRIAADLRPLVLDDLGLLAALEWLATETSRRHGFQLHLSVDPQCENLAEPLASQVYRIVQESLNNAGRHAAASEVWVDLRIIGEELHLGVQDDGRGLRPADLSKKGSFGLVGIRERVYTLAGSVEILGDNGKGTAVRVRLPLPRPEASA